jgi:hypothetical protein
MSFRLFDRGRQDIGTGTIVFGTTGLSMRAVSLSSASTNNLAIASSTNATPIVVTVSGTIPAGWAIGDIVVIRGHTTNTAANGTWVLSAVTTGASGTATLQTIAPQGGTQLNSTGNGVGGATGTIFNLTVASAAAALPAIVTGSSDQVLASVTDTLGVVNCTSPIAFPTVGANAVIDAFIVFATAGNSIFFYDGKMQVRVVTSAAASTTLNVEPLPFGIANGTALVFSNGVTATLSALANPGDTALSVNSVTIAKGHTADAPITGVGLPYTNGSSAQTVNFAVDATYKLFKY